MFVDSAEAPVCLQVHSRRERDSVRSDSTPVTPKLLTAADSRLILGLLGLLQTFGQSRLVAMYAPSEPVLDYNMVIIFLMAVGTVAVGGHWAGSRDRKK